MESHRLNNGKSSEWHKECFWETQMNPLLLPPPLSLGSRLWERGFHLAQVHAKNPCPCDSCYYAAVLKSCWGLVQSFEEQFSYGSFSPRFVHCGGFIFTILLFFVCSFQSQRHIHRHRLLPLFFIQFCFCSLPGKSPGSFPDPTQVLQILLVKSIPARAWECYCIWNGPGEP